MRPKRSYTRRPRGCFPRSDERRCPRPASARTFASLEEVVQDYLATVAADADDYLSYYRSAASLREAIACASMAELEDGKRFSHQRRIPRRVLKKIGPKLKPNELRRCRDFEALHQYIASAIGPIHGIGSLAIYDTAHRLGAYLKKPPRYVYVHAGVREGLKALGLPHRVSKVKMSDLPRPFHRLRPDQVEDCLCIYKRELRTIARRASP